MKCAFCKNELKAIGERWRCMGCGAWVWWDGGELVTGNYDIPKDTMWVKDV